MTMIGDVGAAEFLHMPVHGRLPRVGQDSGGCDPVGRGCLRHVVAIAQAGEASGAPLQMVLEAGIAVGEHHPATARDAVLVAAFDDGGLISYRRGNGEYRHTLNTREGMDRKLRQLGLESSASS